MSGNEVSKIGGGSNVSSSIHCYVCNSRVGVSIRNAIQIFGEQSNLPHTERPLQEAIAELTEKPLHKNRKPSPILCKKCYKLIEEHDELKYRMDEIKNEILQQFSKTIGSENDITQVPKSSTSETITPLANKVIKYESSSSRSPITVPQPIVIKKEYIPAIKHQKKIPVISMKNVTKLPSNFVVVNQQGKIAIQNINTTATDAKETEDASDKEYSKSATVTSETLLLDNKDMGSSNDISGNSLNTSSLQEVDEEEAEESGEGMTATGEGVTEEDMEQEEEYEGVEALDDLEEDGDNFVIGQMEVLDDPTGIALEEGTILVQQVEDGTLRFLRRAEDIYDGEFVNEEVEMSEEDLEDSNVEGAVVTEQARKKPRIMRMKSGKQNSPQSKKVSNTIEDLPSFDQMVKRLDDGVFQCLLCDKEIKEKTSEEGDDVTIEEKNAENKEESSTKVTLKEEEKESDDKDISDGDKDKKDAGGKEEEDNDSSAVKSSEEMSTEAERDTAIEKDKESEKEDDKSTENKTFFGSCKVLMQHMRVIHNITMHICHCGEVFSKRTELNHHLEKHTNDDVSIQEYKCVACNGAVFDNLKTFRIHTKFQHKEMSLKQHVCQICNRKFGSKKLLEEHNNMHIGVKPYSCALCGKSFASKYTYQSHCKTHTDRPRPYSCSQCGKSFFTLQNKTQHEKTHLGIKDFVCNVCGKAFGTQHNLDVHGVVHTGYKPYQCWICKKSFARRAEIRDHERIHTGERPYSCDICGSTFSQRSNLQSHKRATHFDDKRYKCRNCDKSFKRRRLLEYHIKSSHTGERPYKCTVCEATFVYPEHFKKHTRIHSGEKPYRCEVCGKAFNSRDNRNAHRFIHSDKKPYECLDCGAGFMRKPLLYAHMQQQGHLNDTIIVNQPRINNDLETKLDHLEGTFILEDGQEVIINNIKEEALAESQLEAKITIATEDIYETGFMEDASKLIVRAGGVMKHDPIISQGEGLEKEVSEVGVGEDGETTIITGDMIDTQRIHIIHTADQGHQALDIEDSTLKFYQIRLPNGDSGWVALNNTQEDE